MDASSGQHALQKRENLDVQLRPQRREEGVRCGGGGQSYDRGLQPEGDPALGLPEARRSRGHEGCPRCQLALTVDERSPAHIVRK